MPYSKVLNKQVATRTTIMIRLLFHKFSATARSNKGQIHTLAQLHKIQVSNNIICTQNSDIDIAMCA